MCNNSCVRENGLGRTHIGIDILCMLFKGLHVEGFNQCIALDKTSV
jgi:hypothetical protein